VERGRSRPDELGSKERRGNSVVLRLARRDRVKRIVEEDDSRTERDDAG